MVQRKGSCDLGLGPFVQIHTQRFPQILRLSYPNRYYHFRVHSSIIHTHQRTKRRIVHRNRI